MRDADFWDRIAEKYARDKVADEAAYAATLARVRHWLHPDARVLELGCGTGTTALHLADAAARITATDVSGEMVRIARDKAAALGTENVRFDIASAEEAGAGRSFDAVLAFNLLHLLQDPAVLLRHIRDRLPEGGLFISKTVCLGSQPWLKALITPMRWLGKAPSTVRFFKADALEAEIRAAGFRIKESADYPKRMQKRFVVARAI